MNKSKLGEKHINMSQTKNNVNIVYVLSTAIKSINYKKEFLKLPITVHFGLKLPITVHFELKLPITVFFELNIWFTTSNNLIHMFKGVTCLLKHLKVTIM